MWLPFEGFLFAHPNDTTINDEYADFLRQQMVVICSIGTAIREPCAVRFNHPAWKFTPDVFQHRTVSDAERRAASITARRAGHNIPAEYSLINFSCTDLSNAVNAHRRGIWPHDPALQATLLNAADAIVIGADASEVDLARALCCESRIIIDSSWFGHEMMPALTNARWIDAGEMPDDILTIPRTARNAAWEMRLSYSRQLIYDAFADAGITGLRPIESEIQSTQLALSKPRFITLDVLKTLNGTAVPPAVLMR